MNRRIYGVPNNSADTCIVQLEPLLIKCIFFTQANIINYRFQKKKNNNSADTWQGDLHLQIQICTPISLRYKHIANVPEMTL